MSEDKHSISNYHKKRDLKKSGEPSGKKGKPSEKLRFSFQKHDASTLHYDFRLEYNGVLKSWSVPKGPSTNKKDKRLAIHTEDHPLDYIDFEGVIPEGNYGAGKVLVWDIGTYENITEKNGEIKDLEKSIKNGHFLIRLSGKKLNGGYAMTRIKKDKEQWLLVKMDDEYADARRNPVNTEQESVKSGKEIENIHK